LIAKQTALADSPSSLLPTTTSLAKLSKKWTDPTSKVATSASTKLKSVAHNRTAVVVADTEEIVVAAAAEIVAVVVAGVDAIAVAVADVTTNAAGRPSPVNFQKARHSGGPFLSTDLMLARIFYEDG
jgi:hypothetical protein